MKKFSTFLFAFALCNLIALSSLSAGEKPESQVRIDQNYAGVSLGLWHGTGFSVNAEKMIKELSKYNGLLGVGAEIGYANDRNERLWAGGNYGWEHTYIPAFVFLSFNYKISVPKLEPFARAGLGFVKVSGKVFGDFSDSDWAASDSYVSTARFRVSY